MMEVEKLLIQIIRRQNAMIEMMSDFMKAYAKINNIATEEVEDKEEWINDVK